MTEYYKANIFVGKYRSRGLLSRDVADHIGLEDAKVRILRGIDTGESWAYHPQGWPWLILEHGDFWPMMFRLEPDDIEALKDAVADL